MMSTLICTECNGVSVKTDRSVVLPFVCDGCQHVDHESDVHQDPVQQLVQTLADPELRDDSATVDATITMVADLTEQLQVAKELSAGQTELIEQQEKQIAILTSDLAIATNKVNNDAKLIEAMNTAGIEVSQDLINAEQTIEAQKSLMATMITVGGRMTERAYKAEAANAELVGIAQALAFYLGYGAEKYAEESKAETLVVRIIA